MKIREKMTGRASFSENCPAMVARLKKLNIKIERAMAIQKSIPWRFLFFRAARRLP